MYPFPIEDKLLREPEWQEIELGVGQHPPMRKYEWDPISNGVRSSGPIIEGNATQLDKHIRPVP
jgi:hypothetical protein